MVEEEKYERDKEIIKRTHKTTHTETVVKLLEDGERAREIKLALNSRNGPMQTLDRQK